MDKRQKAVERSKLWRLEHLDYYRHLQKMYQRKRRAIQRGTLEMIYNKPITKLDGLIYIR
jgi:hypothetical protein